LTALSGSSSLGSVAAGGFFKMTVFMVWPDLSGYSGRVRGCGAKAFGTVPAIALLLCASLLAATEIPSKPFLEKNSFYLRSAGFRVQLANDSAAKKAMHALPAHRFVIHNLGGGDVRYLYAEPVHCVCVFIGTQANYTDYRSILSQPLRQPDDVSPDYKTQASALLVDDPVGIDTIGDDTIAPYYQAYY
jgi:hypothetical protein